MSIDLTDLLHYRVSNGGYFIYKELKEYLDPLKFDEEKYEYYKPLCENIKLVCWNIYKGGIITYERVDLLHMLKCKEIFDSWLNITGNKNRIIDVGTTEEAERKKQTERKTAVLSKTSETVEDVNPEPEKVEQVENEKQIETYDNYRTVKYLPSGEMFHFTNMQAEAIRILHEAYKNGNPVKTAGEILTACKSDQNYLGKLFGYNNHPAWNNLIIVIGNGAFRLNL